MNIETRRLILRKPRKSDWKDILEGAKELDVSKNLELVPYPYKKKDAVWFVNYALKNWNKKKQEKFEFFIELKSENKIIGVTAISLQKDKTVATTGSWINKKYWRNGYILEAKIPIIDFVFNKLKLRRLESEAWTKNIASNEMSKKLGYKLEGTKRKAKICKATGKICDSNFYGMLKKDWKKNRPRLIKELNKKLEDKNDRTS